MVASMVYEVPEEFGSATCTSSLYLSESRPFQHFGSGSVRLEVRIAGPAPHHVAARVRRLGLHLGVGLAARLARHRDLDPGLSFERREHGAAPLLLHAAIQHQVALRYRQRGDQQRQSRENTNHEILLSNF